MTLDLLTITDTDDSAPILVPKAPGILRVVIYARISKIGKSNSTNTAIQVAECLREIKYLGKDRGVKVVIVAIFQEDDKSASKYSKKPRPLWNRTVELVHGNWVDMVMATEMERLTRRPNEMSVLIDAADPIVQEGNPCDLREINLTSDDVFDLTTGNGIYRARQAVALAERESNKLSKRARDKQDHLAEEGRPHSGHRTYGFTVGNGALDDAEVKVLQQMAEKRLKAWSYKDIAYWLNENGHKTSQGKNWFPITVRNTLRRKCYAPWPADPNFAIREHKGAEYQATWPPVFDPDVWEQLQIIAKLGADKYKDRPKPRKYPLTSLLVCGNCGMTLNGETKRDKPERPLRRVYYCRVQGDTERKRGCGGVTCGSDPLEDFILDCVFYRLDTPDLAQLLKDDTDNSARIKELLDARSHQERRIQEILDDYAEGELTREQKNRGKAKAEAKLDEINQEIDKLNRGHRASALIPLGKTLQEAWKENNSVQWRRETLGLLIDEIVIHPGGGKPRYECKYSEGVFKFDPNRVEIKWKV